MTHCLITGGAGFIGSHLADELVRRGHEVTVIDNLSVGDDNVPLLEKIGAKLVVADIADFDAIESSFEGVDVVFHLAAMNRAPRSVEHPVEAHHANITGTLMVLEAMREHGVPKIVFSSSSSVYAGREGLLKEDDPVAPPHPYGVGKLAAEHYIRIYSELFGIEFVTLRFFSVFGTRQLGDISHAAVIPKFIHQAKSGKPLTIFGDGSQTRNFTYVDDVVRCCILAAEADKAAGHVINIANPVEVTIKEIADAVREVTGIEADHEFHPRPPGDPLRNAPDLTKAEQVLGFRPETPFVEGIRKAFEWYEEKHGP